VDTAGRSAARQAEKDRQKAARLLARADRFDSGARGERATADALKALSPAFTVLHDLSIPGHRANIDHLVIGPTGVFVVDSKNHRGPLRVGDGTIWQGRRPMRREVERVVWEAESASAAIGAPVEPLLCFVAAELPAAVVEVGGVRAVTPTTLLDVLQHGPADLSLEATARLVLAAQRNLPPYGTTAPRSVPTTGRRQPKALRTAQRGRATRTSREIVAAAVGGLALVALGVVGVKAVPGLVASLSDSVLPKPDAPAINGGFSCPSPGSGWSLSIDFPGTAYGTSTYHFEWAEVDGSQWNPLLPVRRASDPQLPIGGRQPGSQVQVRGRAVSAAGSEGAVGTGVFTAPADPC
jgi:hypothetical protein